MRTKLFVPLTVLALLLGTVTPAFAQDSSEVFCGDLSAEDCTILQDSNAAMQGVAQYNSIATFNSFVSGLPGLPAEVVSVDVTVDGAFAMDEAAMSAAQEIAGLSTEERANVLAEAPESVIALLGGWDADLTLSATMTPELADEIALQSGLPVPSELAIAVRLVDGNFYWDVSEVAAFIPTVASGWVGIPLVDLLNELDSQGVFDQAADSMTSGTGALGASVAAPLAYDPSIFEPFLSIERGDDTTAGDQDAAVFTTTFDWNAYLTSPEFQQTIVGLAQAGAFEGTGLSVSDIEQNVQMLGMVAPMIAEGLTSVATQTIGVDDGYRYDYQSEFAWDLSGLINMAATTGQLPPELAPTSDNVGLSLLTQVTNSDFATEQTAEFEAPADAAMIPVETLLAAPTAP